MIRTKQLTYEIGDFQLKEANFQLGHGEYFALLGPPGAGKSIFLECLCGLRRPLSGKIFLDGRDVTRLEPRRRKIGYVPQDYALFPHLTVERNIQFGLRRRGFARLEINQRVIETAERLGIRKLLGRSINGLSGGERQRVALGRALVLEPKVLLLDEPVSALDESTRETVCGDLRRLQQQLNLTIIHVSHNLEEAFSVADRAGILRGGVFQQVGMMDELLRRPVSEFVARFMRCENILTGRLTGLSERGPFSVVRVDEVDFLMPEILRGGTVKFVVRPENIVVSRSAEQEGAGQGDSEQDGAVKMVIPVKCVRAADRGAYVRLVLEAAGLRLIAHVSHQSFTELPIPSGVPHGRGGDLCAVIRPQNVKVITEEK
ncbi:MAG: ATP-binding cassette domain-containing protein [Sedimentisphaerales bacterium]|nr:ATP-binding cassette domain-containing protein [Sedimentisphaerales bacterium]